LYTILSTLDLILTPEQIEVIKMTVHDFSEKSKAEEDQRGGVRVVAKGLEYNGKLVLKNSNQAVTDLEEEEERKRMKNDDHSLADLTSLISTPAYFFTQFA